MGSSKEIPAGAATGVSGGISPEHYRTVIEFLEDWGWEAVPSMKAEYKGEGVYSKLVGGVLKLISAHNGRISCILNVKPPILNGTGRMHGMGVASVAERVAIGCAKTVVGKEKDNLFLGELSVSFLSSAPRNAEVVVNGCVVKSGRNLTIVDVSFRSDEESGGRLLYLSRATFYNMPLSTL
ncbi:hypothetical protein C2S52_018409 [Perilla frutescens var. hirtella]|nr:hypothetical protein C2S52_018409 [Perilla frutescens var. hirtella]KAH6812119.1 hypothetical protein C2S51_025881 [Perilla frutescens var. frutescens]